MDKYYKNIKQLIETNLVEVKKNEISSNYHTLITYYNVGKELIEAQGGEKRAKYGNTLIKDYSTKLTKEFGKGYDYTNLFRMRQLYLCFEKVGAMRQQLNPKNQIASSQISFLNISWTHYRILLPIKNESKRNYYINSTIENNFSSRNLIKYIKTNAYEY